ncbi:MAG: LysM domain-containing protein [Nocardioidaceae bacterium]
MSTATLTAPHQSDVRIARPRAARPASPARSTPRAVSREVAPVRLTRRGRLLLLMVVLALAFAAFTLLSSPAVSTDQTHHATQHTVVVGAGQTLWDIATRIAPGEDPRTVIADIVDLNELPDAGSIRIGQQLFVPQY